ncbi:MAG: flagellar basal body rod C-terminal domain-containing protein, partial [Betaproteobacteria bacterium]
FDAVKVDCTGAIHLNGIELPSLKTQPNLPLTPADVANWVNGASTIDITEPTFSGLGLKLGGVALSVQNLNPTPDDLDTLAGDLQASLRLADGTNYISVSVDSNGTDLHIKDALGRSLSDIVLTPKTGLSSGGNFLVANSLTSRTNVRALAYNDIRVPSQQLDYKRPLRINDQLVPAGYKDVTSLVAAINGTNAIGVVASVQQGDLVISAVPTGVSIKINPTPTVNGDGNALGVAPITYNGQVRMTQIVRELSIPSTNVDFNKQLEINGVAIDMVGITSVQQLAEKINDPTLSPSPGIKAFIGFYGDLVLSTIDLSGEATISVGPRKNPDGTYEQNTLGLEPIDYTVEERLKLQLANDPANSSIRFSFGTYGDPPKTGSPFDLANAGLRTGAFIKEGSKDDLLVFITGQGKASVASSYEGKPLNMRDNLRAQSLVVKFTAADRYTIVDAKTNTQLADRFFDPTQLEPMISFQGLQIKLSFSPNIGDSFQVDGNHDGLGNNINMLDMVDLAKKPVISGKTLANTYIDQINNVGNLAQQATITQQALTVVNDQAVAARDKVSGVNLDEEAASLIRYQQAYQASAKALQISGTLFDAIVQIR